MTANDCGFFLASHSVSVRDRMEERVMQFWLTPRGTNRGGDEDIILWRALRFNVY